MGILMAVATTLLLIAQKLHRGYFISGYFTDHSLTKIADFAVGHLNWIVPSRNVAAKMQLFKIPISWINIILISLLFRKSFPRLRSHFKQINNW